MTNWIDPTKKSPRKGQRYIVKGKGFIVGARYSGSCMWSCDLKPDNRSVITHYMKVPK